MEQLGLTLVQLLAPQALLALPVQPDLQVQQVQQGLLVVMVQPVLLAQQVRRELRAQRQMLQVQRDLLVRLVHKVYKVSLDPQDQPVLRPK
jgi:hypothetical protein